MRSTMQDAPLSIATLVRYGTSVHGDSELSTWTGESARRISFSELGREAARLAWALEGLGVNGDQRVATLMFNNAEHMAAYCAVPAMGAVLHTLNLRLAPDQIAYIANHAEDSVLLVDAAVVPLLAVLLPQLKTVRHVVVTGDADTTALEGAGVPVHRWAELLQGGGEGYDWRDPADERDAAAICYTSGTTGQPRGVVYSHRSVWLHSMQVCMGDGFALSQRSRILPVVPMFHAAAWGLPYAALFVGADLVMPDRFLQPEPLAALIAAERPTFGAAVPTIWTDLLRHLDAHGGDVSSLEEVVIGGSACPPALQEAYATRYGVRVIHAWGMTETSPLGSVSRAPAGFAAAQRRRYAEMQGRLPAALQARLRGLDGALVAHDGDSVGELEVRGPWVAGGYAGGEAADRFTADGWLRTGDIASLTADGFLRLTDRSKDIIKSGGEWISSVALENALMAHPAVAEACVVGVADARWGERPLAAVVRRDGSELPGGAAELREFLGAQFARWQLPEHWTFVDAVPKTSVGKFDKVALRSMLAADGLEVTELTSTAE